MLTTVHADSDRLSRLITELLDVARIDTGRLPLLPAARATPRCSSAGSSSRSGPGTAPPIEFDVRRRPARDLRRPRQVHPGRHQPGRERRSGTARARCTVTASKGGRRRGVADQVDDEGDGHRRRRSGSGCSPSSGRTGSAAAPAWASTSSTGWSAPTAARVTIDDAAGGGARDRRSTWPAFAATRAGRTRARRETRSRRAAATLPRLARALSRARTSTAKGTHVGPELRLRPGRGHPAAGRGGRRAMRDEALAAIAGAPPTSTRSSRSGSTTPATARRWRWPTARSARCRRRPARRPASASARPAARSTRRWPSAQAVLEAEARGADAGRGDRRRHPARPTAPARRAAPDHADVRLHRRPVRGDGLGGRRGPGASRPSGSTSTPSTSAPTTRRARCRTPSGPSRPSTTSCCAPTPRRCRRARC